MNVELKELPALRLAAVEHVGPYDRLGEAFARLGPIMGRAGLFGPSTQMIALYHDDPETTPREALRSDAAFTVPDEAPLPDGVREVRIPPSRYACTIHVGPYAGLGLAWAQLIRGWLPKSGHRLGAGPSFEIYRNTPADAPPEKLVTELYVPIA